MSNLIRIEQSEIKMLQRVFLMYTVDSDYDINRDTKDAFSTFLEKISTPTFVQPVMEPDKVVCTHRMKTEILDCREFVVGYVCDHCKARFDQHKQLTFVPPTKAEPDAQQLIDTIKARRVEQATDKYDTADEQTSPWVSMKDIEQQLAERIEVYQQPYVKLSDYNRNKLINILSMYEHSMTWSDDILPDFVQTLITNAFEQGRKHNKETKYCE